jgi:O-methyltransferase
MIKVLKRLLGPFPFFWFGMRYAAKVSSGFTREETLDLAMCYVLGSRVEGDYLEFGVAEGQTFAAACYLSQKRGLSMNCWAFDSFEGIPENKEADASGHQMFQAGERRCSEYEFLRNVRRTGADMKRVITVPGWFEGSLRPDNPRLVNLRKAAVVWVDCDLYSSTTYVLNFLTKYLQYGSLVIFDDWFCYRADPNAGEQRAFREWLDLNPHFSAVELSRISWHGNSFIIHRAVGT